jgi:hypothetical protein
MRFFVLFFLFYLLALTAPGYMPFNRIRPFVLGIPFSFAWVILWVILGWIVLIRLYLGQQQRDKR